MVQFPFAQGGKYPNHVRTSSQMCLRGQQQQQLIQEVDPVSYTTIYNHMMMLPWGVFLETFITLNHSQFHPTICL